VLSLETPEKVPCRSFSEYLFTTEDSAFLRPFLPCNITDEKQKKKSQKNCVYQVIESSRRPEAKH